MRNLLDTSFKTRLGKRLKALFAFIPPDASVVYDLCCDHGAVGRATLEALSSSHVVFNDIHPGIMQTLSEKLVELNASNYTLHTGPAETLNIKPSTRPVFILAGIGDEQTINILQWLFAQPSTKNALFVISPATKVFYVRHFLFNQNINITAQHAVTENNRTYEILIVDRLSTNKGTPSENSALIGNCWEIKNADHIKHLQKLIDYYAAKLNPSNYVVQQKIVDGYKTELNKLVSNP